VLSILCVMLIGVLSIGRVVPQTLVVQYLVSVTYLMAASLVVTGPLQLLFTRFISDRLFEKRQKVVLPNLFGALMITTLVSGLGGVILSAAVFREAFFYGADAILLIARILSQQQLEELISMCRELGMAPLTEIHDKDDLEKALACGAEIIGINNRDLDSFKVDIGTTFALAPLVPQNHVLVSESGIGNGGDIRSLEPTGIHAVLVGSALMKSKAPAAKTAEIVKAGEI